MGAHPGESMGFGASKLIRLPRNNGLHIVTNSGSCPAIDALGQMNLVNWFPRRPIHSTLPGFPGSGCAKTEMKSHRKSGVPLSPLLPTLSFTQALNFDLNMTTRKCFMAVWKKFGVLLITNRGLRDSVKSQG
jgi:hypothetical protein